MGLRRPYLALVPLLSDQRIHDLREVFDAVRWLAEVHIAVGNLLALHVTPDDRAQVAQLAKAAQQTSAHSVPLAYVDLGYTDHGPIVESVRPSRNCARRPTVLAAGRSPDARPPATRCRAGPLGPGRLDYECPADTLAGLHFVAFACLILSSAAPPLAQGFG